MITPVIGLQLSADSAFSRPPLAIIVTGQEWVSLSMESLLSPRGFAVVRVFTGLQALQRAREISADLLIIDRDLRDTRGVDLIEALRQDGAISAAAPIMLLSTGLWSAADRVEGLRSGAWEVCSLPTNGEELVLKLETWVRAKLATDSTREQGLFDPDTGLYNAKGLLRRLSEIGAGATRHSRPLACVVLAPELEENGDDAAPALVSTKTAAAVEALAATLRQTGRASDTIGRLSSTEFVVLAPDTDEAGVRGLTNRLEAALRTQQGAAQAVAPQPFGTSPSQPWRLRFGSYAVEDFREASIAPSEMLIRAAAALRS